MYDLIVLLRLNRELSSLYRYHRRIFHSTAILLLAPTSIVLHARRFIKRETWYSA